MSPTEETSVPYLSLEKKELHQGDVLIGVNFKYSSLSKGGDPETNIQFPFPYAVVLSQSCDLQQHYVNLKKKTELKNGSCAGECDDDKVLDTILICPAFPHESFLKGTHIEGRQMSNFQNAKGRESTYRKLKDNDALNRFHYLPALEKTLPELVIDFKKFHTIPIDIIEKDYQNLYRISLKELYRERLSQRFSNYLSRIGLPKGV